MGYSMDLESKMKKALVQAHKRGDTRAANLFAENIRQYRKKGTLPSSVPESVAPSFDERPQLKEDEGLKKNKRGEHIVYRDSLGNLTGGIGRLLEGRGDWKEGDVIPEDTVNEWFEADYSTAKEDMKALLGDSDVPDELKAVITNMSFQLGRTNLKKFEKTLQAAKEGNYEEMAKEVLESEWAKQTPNRAKRLHSRILRLSENSE